jgi:hypothetical protein
MNGGSLSGIEHLPAVLQAGFIKDLSNLGGQLRDESLEESNWGRSGRLRSRSKPFNTFKSFKSLKLLRA